MFNLRKWGEKTAKAAATAIVALLIGPKVAPVLATFGVTLDTTQTLAAVYAVLLSLSNALKHQAWVPGIVKWVL